MAHSSRTETGIFADLDEEIRNLAAKPNVRSAYAWFLSGEAQLVGWQLEVARIPAPPFGEQARSEWMLERFLEHGLHDVHVDEVGNVFGVRPGVTDKVVAVSAHMDTVFPAGTPLNVRRQGARLYGPGVSDNGAGLAALLGLAAALGRVRIETLAPILFIANVGEEGEGDLRGMRQIFSDRRWLDSIACNVVLDGAGNDTIVAEALGSRRFEVTVRGPGGHSWSDFGAPNPIVILSHAIREFAATSIPSTPKTTFNVGVIRGGTSVNSIPESASMRVDIRSASGAEIDRLESALRAAVECAVAEANRRPGEAVEFGIVNIGDRPAGELSPGARILRTIREVDRFIGNSAEIQRASTDANIPLSLGREAIAIGGGGTGGGAHTLQEWFDCGGRELGLKRILLTLLVLAGVGE